MKLRVKITVYRLIQEALSDLGSRLFMRIRDKLGLAYYVGAQNFVGLVPGYFAFYAGTEPDKVALVEVEMLSEAASLLEHGLTEAELMRSKAKVIGQKKISRQDLGSYAMNAALDELYGFGYQHSELEHVDLIVLNDTNALFSGNPLSGLREGGAIFLTDGYFNLAILPNHEQQSPNGLYHFGFEVESGADIVERLKKRNHPRLPKDRPGNRPYAETRGSDPDGNLFDISEHGFMIVETVEDRKSNQQK